MGSDLSEDDSPPQTRRELCGPHPTLASTIALSAISNKSENTHYAILNPQKKRGHSGVWPRRFSVSPRRKSRPRLGRRSSPLGFVNRDRLACYPGNSGCDRDSGRSRSVFDAQKVEDGRDVPFNCAST